MYAIPQIVGIASDDLQLISIQLFDQVDNRLLEIEYGQIFLQPQNLRFYTANVVIMAQLEGLQFYMKKWFILTL